MGDKPSTLGGGGRTGPGTAPPERPGELTAGEILAELERALASPAFSRAERPGRFLRFLVEHALAGDGNRISEYVLATEVFNRKSTFDPASDAIVRVETGRLRRKLQEYYRTEGAGNPLVIELPQRTYVPVFRARSEPSRPVFTTASTPRAGRLGAAALVIALGILAGLAAYWTARTLDSRSAAARGDPPAAAGASATPARSILVLPFADLSPSHDQEYFCDGLTEELTETLTEVEGLKVVARTTAFRFKGFGQDVREIGRQLDVGLVLEGSVRKDRDRLRISAQLIKTADGYHLWSRTYDREIKDVFLIQEEIAHGIATTVMARLDPGWKSPAVQHRPNLEAYDHYLRGLYFARRWDAGSLARAVAELEGAVAGAPAYAPAHASLAECYAMLGVHAGHPPTTVMPKAQAAAVRALQIDQNLPKAQASLALIRAVYDWNWKAAEEGFRRALQADPADTSVREMYVMGYLVPQGKLDEALREVQEISVLDPLSPRLQSILGLVYCFKRQYDLAIEQFRAPLERAPGLKTANLAPGSTYEQKARLAEAIAYLQEGSTAMSSGTGTPTPAHVYALMGRRPEAEKLLQQLLADSKTGYVPPAYVANLYAGLGDRDRTLEWLEKAHAAHSAWLAFLKVDPRYDGVRSDPRFTALLKRVGLM